MDNGYMRILTQAEYDILPDGIAARDAEARRQAEARKKAEVEAEAQQQAEEKRQQEEKAAEKKRKQEARAAYFSGLWSDRWYNVGVYWDVYDFDVFDLGYELEKGYEPLPTARNLLHGGKIGMELGLRHFSIGTYFVIAGYKVTYRREGSLNGYGPSMDGFGYGGDFFVGYSIYMKNAGGSILLKATIGPGITVLNFHENPNIPSLFPYLQQNIRFAIFNLGIKLELPVIDGEVTPRFGTSIGLGWAWGLKK
jgi:hypothetical protein